MAWEFHVGQRVVCIHDFHAKVQIVYPGAAFPIVDRIYTIRSIASFDGLLGLRLVEVVNPKDWLMCPSGQIVFAEAVFAATGFRPLVEWRLDQFRIHLAPRQPELVP